MKYLFLIILMSLGMNSYAHDHNLATFTIENLEGRWVLKIDFTTTAIYSALNEKYDGNLEDLTEKEFKEMVVKYFQETIHLSMDNKMAVEIGGGGIKLGSHSSQLVFLLPNFSDDWNLLKCNITCFEDNDKQTNLIRIKKVRGKTFKEFLRPENQFQTIFFNNTQGD